LAVTSVVVTTGSLCIREVDRAQGGWPWDWLAFRSPASLLAMLLLLQCARIEPAPGARTRDWLEAVVRGHRLVIGGLVAALFLGGWSLPGLTPAQQDARPALDAAGAVVYLAKVGVVVSTIAGYSWVSSASSHRQRSRMTAVAYVPLSIACLLGSAVYAASWGPPAAVQHLASASLVVVSLLVAVGLGHRLIHGLTSATAEVHLSPFL
jgi:NADH-quinone oxidoreductase subunit H